MLISMVYTPTSFLKKKRITEILVPNYLCVLIKFYYFFSYFNFFDVFLHIERISNAQKKSPSFVSLGQIVSNVDLPNPNPAISHVTHDITINMIIISINSYSLAISIILRVGSSRQQVVLYLLYLY